MAAVALTSFLLSNAPALADTTVESAFYSASISIPPASSLSDTDPQEVPLFDPALGTLNSVTVDVDQTSSGGINVSCGGGGFGCSVGLGASLTHRYVSLLAFSPTQGDSASAGCSGSPGCGDFEPLDPAPFNDSYLYTAPGDLAQFTGIGTFTFTPVLNGSAATLNGGGIGASFFGHANGSLSGNVQVTYDFTPAPLGMGSLAGLAGPLIFHDVLAGESSFPTAPEVDLTSLGGMISSQFGNAPPGPPTFGSVALHFDVSDTAGALPYEVQSVGSGGSSVGTGGALGLAALFKTYQIDGTGYQGAGVALNTIGGTAIRAEISRSPSGDLLVVQESIGGTTTGVTSTPITFPGNEQFLIELLYKPGATTASALLRTAGGDVTTPSLTLTSAAIDTIATFGALAFVLNALPEHVEVDLMELGLYAAPPPVPSLGGAGLLSLGALLAASAAVAFRRFRDRRPPRG